MSAITSTSSLASDSLSDDDPGAAAFVAALQAGATPEPATTVCAWADEHRMLSGRQAAEAGRWSTARTPYLREPFDALGATSPIRRVVVMKAAQLGFTESAVNWLGYVIHHAPGPFLFVQPTVELGKRLSRQRIETAIAESPALRARIAPPRSRDAANTVLLKEFPGGLVAITGANSAAGLCSLSARYLALDEIDRFPGDVEGEGDPVALVEARARTFGARRKELLMSTPTIAGLSRIDREYQATDQRRYFVPCPECGEMQTLVFARLEWEPGKPKSARYRCAACGHAIREAAKTKMLAAGEWRATAPSADPGVVGYHLSALYAPVGWLSWAEIAATAELAARDPQKEQGLVNTILGEPFAQRTDAPDWKRLRERQTDAPLGVVPRGPCFLTAGVDVQRDRLECSVWGWGRGRRSWLVDHIVLDGDIAGDGPWDALSAVIARVWPVYQEPVPAEQSPKPTPIALSLARVAIDTGFATTQVYAWARRQLGRVLLVRGGPPGPALVSLPRTIDAPDTMGSRRRRSRRGAMRIWQVNVHALKIETYGWLNLDASAPGSVSPPGWIALPAVGDEYLRQLVAEALVRKVSRGVERQEWVKVYNRNEALDCRVYARAAAYVVGLDRFTDADWSGLEAQLGIPAAPSPAPPLPVASAPTPAAPTPHVIPPPDTPSVPPRRRPRSDFWRGYPRR